MKRMETRNGNKRKLEKPKCRRGRNRGTHTHKPQIEIPNIEKCQREQKARGKQKKESLKKIMRKKKKKDILTTWDGNVKKN